MQGFVTVDHQLIAGVQYLGQHHRIGKSAERPACEGEPKKITTILQTKNHPDGGCTKPCTKASQRIPVTVADYRTSNLLILLMPAVDRPPVTAVVASSSLVPAIFSPAAAQRKAWVKIQKNRAMKTARF